MKHQILVPEVVAESGLNLLQEHGLQIKQTSSIRKEDLIADLKDCDGVIMRVARLDADVLSAGKSER